MFDLFDLDGFLEKPVVSFTKTVSSPIEDGIEVVSGLTEGELRVKAAVSLGADVVSGMAVAELIDWHTKNF